MSARSPWIKEVTAVGQPHRRSAFAMAAIVLSILLIVVAVSDRDALWTVAAAEGDVVDEMAAQASESPSADTRREATVTALHKP